MTEAKRDNNQIPTMTGVLNTDGTTITLIKANPTTHEMLVNDNTTGSDFGSDDAKRDNNYTPILLATSSSDGATPVPLYVDTNGNFLIKST